MSIAPASHVVGETATRTSARVRPTSPIEDLAPETLLAHLTEGVAYCRMIEHDGAPDFVYLAVNDAFTTLTRLENVVGRRVSEVIPDICKTDPELLAFYGQVASGGGPRKFELCVRALQMWFSITAYSPADGYFVALFEVTTERKRAERALLFQSELAQLLQSVSDDGMYAAVMAAVEATLESPYGLFGYVAENGDLVCPSLSASALDACQLPEKSMVVPAANWSASGWGSVVRAQRSFSTNQPLQVPPGHVPLASCLAVPLVYAGRVMGALLVANRPGGYHKEHLTLLEGAAARLAPLLDGRLRRERHEAERHRAEESAQEALETLDLALEAGGLGTWQYWPATGRFEAGARARILIGATEDGPLARDALWRYLHPEDRVRVEDSIRTLVASGAATFPEGEVRFVWPDGSIHWMAIRGRLSIDERQPHLTGVLLDITDRKAAQEALKATEARVLEQSQQLQRALVDALGALGATLEKRDPYTAGHQRRVATLATAIGRELGLDQFRLDGLALAASVHDIGKIQVPAELLSKPTRLTMYEYELIKTHPTTGYEILKNIAFPWPLADMVHQHHEMLDGSGYPQKLVGTAINLEARILAVSDIVEAMSSHRPYRPARGINMALEEVERMAAAGKLDGAVVGACVKLFRSGAFAFPTPISE